ncbi:hypothetical protein [Mahella australiensis]|jgi:hypothetical protein|uniref:ABC-2 type transporter n=1 Tax=Mahella australiensis (strain DSM 15567 / CIP 107919 / 50-1 BON) TaxID=697281 RepID=F3ZZ38_MAHA5|nr:hypothetical protein [Mahella australiensis]AEE96797.1 hypothetical protein Mahau_1611 [Mahella australiensis 50-1 BON]
MIKKLIAYEIQNSWRVFFLIYAVLLLIAALVKAKLISLPDFFYVHLMFIDLFLTIGILTNRFWQSIYGQEANFLLTVPANTAQLMASKAINSLLWLLVSFVVMGMTFMWQGNPLGKLMLNYITLSSIIITGLMILSFLYTAISLAHHPFIQKDYLGMTVLFFIVLYSIFSLLQNTTEGLIPYTIRISMEGITVNSAPGNMMIADNFTIVVNSAVWSIFMIFVNFTFTGYMIKRKLIVP